MRKILVITLSNLGDVAATAPVLSALKEKFPEARLEVLVGPKAESVISDSPDLDRVIIYDKRTSWLEKIKLGLALRKEKFDIVIDLRNTAYPFIVGAKHRSKLIRWGEGRDVSMRKRHLGRLHFLGIKDFSKEKFRFVSESTKAKSLGLLNELSLESKKFIALAPGARDSKKQWSPENFGRLGKRIKEELNLPVLLLGAPDESEILKKVQAASGNVLTSLKRPISFHEVMGILSHSKLFCGNDSGLLQVAHEMGIPNVSVFGPTISVNSGHFDSYSRSVLSFTREPKDERGGLDQISIDRMYEACAGLLTGKKGKYENSLGVIHLPPKPRILISRIDRIGDVLLTTPSLRILKEIYPDSFLGVLVSPETASTLEGNPYIDKVYIYDKKGKEKSPLGTFRFAGELARDSFDAALHFHATNRVFWLSFLAKIPIRIGHKRKLWRLLTHSIEERKREGKKHESEYNLELLEVLGIRWLAKLPPLFFPLKESDKLSLIEKCPEIKKPYAVISPSASCISKRWPPERFRSVGEKLHEKYGSTLFVIGTKNEKPICDEVLRDIKAPAFDMAGKLSLGELGWLIKEAQILISNDSGPVHIASAVGTPVVSLFGRSDKGLSPIRWRPLGEKSVYIHKDYSEETLAYNEPCKRLLEIRPEEVLEEAEKLL